MRMKHKEWAEMFFKPHETTDGLVTVCKNSNYGYEMEIHFLALMDFLEKLESVYDYCFEDSEDELRRILMIVDTHNNDLQNIIPNWDGEVELIGKLLVTHFNSNGAGIYDVKNLLDASSELLKLYPDMYI